MFISKKNKNKKYYINCMRKYTENFFFFRFDEKFIYIYNEIRNVYFIKLNQEPTVTLKKAKKLKLISL